MKQEEFLKILESLEIDEHEKLGLKNQEYVGEGGVDYLQNFKRGAALQGTIPEKQAVSYCTKHLVSIADMVNRLESGENADILVWEEKITDARNYFALLWALLQEREDQKPKLAKKKGD